MNKRTRTGVAVFGMLAGIWMMQGCDRKSSAPSVAASAPASAGEASKRGSIEVTARLVEIPGVFPPNKLYDYMYILKYQVLKVHRGQVDSEFIFVAHYNPLKPRAQAADKFVKDVGGNLPAFQGGQIHRLALEASMDTYMGGIIDKYFGQKGTRYQAVWTDIEQ